MMQDETERKLGKITGVIPVPEEEIPPLDPVIDKILDKMYYQTGESTFTREWREHIWKENSLIGTASIHLEHLFRHSPYCDDIPYGAALANFVVRERASTTNRSLTPTTYPNDMNTLVSLFERFGKTEASLDMFSGLQIDTLSRKDSQLGQAYSRLTSLTRLSQLPYLRTGILTATWINIPQLFPKPHEIPRW